MEDIKEILKKAKSSMEDAITHTSTEFTKIRAGKAMPAMLDGILALYYGTPTPIAQIASITAPDARTLLIKPWEKNVIPEIEKAIQNSELALNPQNDGESVRLAIPALTEERRKGLVKQVKSEAEQGKIRIRSIRKETKDALKALQKDGTSEDLIKKTETDVQNLTNDFSKKIDELVATKETEIMTV